MRGFGPALYGFAQQSGGSVRIETELNVGASVILTQPASGEAPRSAAGRDA